MRVFDDENHDNGRMSDIKDISYIFRMILAKTMGEANEKSCGM